MLTLTQNVLTEDSPAINVPIYNPTELTAGAAHIGAGNLHRVHPITDYIAASDDPEKAIELFLLCFDGASKLPAFLLHTLSELDQQHKPTHCLAFLMAAYGHYLQAEAEDKGNTHAVNEPLFQESDWLKINDHDLLAFLDSTPFAAANLRAIPHFAATYKLYRKQIAIYGVAFSLRQAMCTFWEAI